MNGLLTTLELPPLDVVWEAARVELRNSQGEVVAHADIRPPIRAGLHGDVIEIHWTIRFKDPEHGGTDMSP